MWNNSKELYKLQNILKNNAKKYSTLGMTPEQIIEICNFDKEIYLSNRRYNRYIHQNGDEILENISNDFYESNNTPSVYDTYSLNSDPLLDGIEDDRLINIITHATKSERDIISYLKDGYSQSEIAHILGVSKAYISKILKKFRKFNFHG